MASRLWLTRELFTIESPSRTPATNSITNKTRTHSDEHAFFQVKRLDAAGSEFLKSVFLIPRERYDGFTSIILITVGISVCVRRTSQLVPVVVPFMRSCADADSSDHGV